MKSSPKVYFYSAFILATLLSIMYTLSFLLAFDTPIAYFSTNSALPVISKYLMLSTCIWIFSMFILIPKGTLSTERPTISSASKIASCLASAGLLTYSAIKLFSLSLSKLSLIGVVLALLSILFFVLNAIPSSKSRNNIHAIAGIFVILWAAVCMTEAYINWFITMNNPTKILLMISMMSIMFSALYEVKYIVGTSAPRAYAVFNLIGICISASFSVSFIIIYVSGIYRVHEFIPAAIASLTITIYQICRSIDFISTQSKASTV